ncbi:MAG: NAD(P)H-hydrate epimerase [Spirochaetia bacterium]|nr:NAD(P)H-hydrate epimerase [Spirochaetia bacterium]
MIPDYLKSSGIPILSGKEAEEWDKFTIYNRKVDSKLLMAWAGYSVFISINNELWYKEADEIHFLLGPGNNGGDGYVIAWHVLCSSGKKIFFWQLSEPKTPDSKYFYNLCLEYKGQKLQIETIEKFNNHKLNIKSTIVDCIFGTGISKALTFPVAEVVHYANKAECKKIAIDIATGIFASGQFFSHEVFNADITYTFGSYKVGHLIEPGILYSGKVIVNSIGFFKKEFENRFILESSKIIPLRKAYGHKYTSGVINILGGSLSMEGAAVMAAYAFLKIGGGISKIFSTAKNIKKYLKDYPELMFVSGNIKVLEKEYLKQLKPDKDHICLIGVGLKEKPSHTFWKTILSMSNVTLVLDGSVLTKLYDHHSLFQKNKLKNLVISPHFSEAEKLLNKNINNVREAAMEIAKIYNASVYLKGPGGILIIKEGDKITEIYPASTHYELSTGGTGDVLSGMICNMLARYNNLRPALEQALSLYLWGAESAVNNIANNCKDFITATEIIKEIQNKSK